MLEVDDGSRLGRFDHERGLHAQISRNLENVEHLGGRDHLIGIVHIREQGQTSFGLDFFENAEPFVQPWSLVVVDRTAVVLLKRRFVDDWNAGAFRDFDQLFGHGHHGVFFFDHTGARNQKQSGSPAGNAVYVDDVFAHKDKGSRSEPSFAQVEDRSWAHSAFGF